jgi:hypothetical protein
MLHSDPEKSSRSTGQVFVGCLLGLPIALAVTLLVTLLAASLQWADWGFQALIAVVLIGVGVWALRRIPKSGVALGVVIAMAIALLLDGLCAVALRK